VPNVPIDVAVVAGNPAVIRYAAGNNERRKGACPPRRLISS
jgi:hypothetical protein